MEIDASGNKSSAITSSASRTADSRSHQRMECREDLPIPLRLHLSPFPIPISSFEVALVRGKPFCGVQSNLPMNINAKGNVGPT